jgi:HK97 family phage major capsid protein
MNKKIIELKEKREALVDAMSAITGKAETEKRNINEAEIAEFDKHEADIKEIDVQLRIAERQFELDKERASRQMPKNQASPEEKLSKRFDLFKAIREKIGGNLTGAEAEITQEGRRELRELGQAYDETGIQIPYALLGSKRAEIGTSDGTPPIPVIDNPILSIVRTPLVMDKLGVTVYPGLTGNFPLPRMAQLSAAFVNEKSAVSTSGQAFAKNTLTPRRVGATDFFTKELLSQTNPQIQAAVWQDFVDAVWRAVQVDLFDNVAAGSTVVSGRTISTAAAILAWSDILYMEKTIENEFDGMAYVMSHGQKALLKAKDKGTDTAKYIWGDDNMINGYNAFATAALAATNGGMTNTCFDVIFGYWKAAAVGMWGGVELLVNPYAADEKGEIKITVSGLFDSDVANPLSFAAIRNATV